MALDGRKQVPEAPMVDMTRGGETAVPLVESPNNVRSVTPPQWRGAEPTGMAEAIHPKRN